MNINNKITTLAIVLYISLQKEMAQLANMNRDFY